METIRGRAFSFNSEKVHLKVSKYLNDIFPGKSRNQEFQESPKQLGACHWLSFFSPQIPSRENIAISIYSWVCVSAQAF